MNTSQSDHSESSEEVSSVLFPSERNNVIENYKEERDRNKVISHLCFDFIGEDEDAEEIEYLLSFLTEKRESVCSNVLSSVETNNTYLSRPILKELNKPELTSEEKMDTSSSPSMESETLLAKRDSPSKYDIKQEEEQNDHLLKQKPRVKVFNQ